LKEKLYADYLRARKMSEEAIAHAVEYVKSLEGRLKARGRSLGSATVDDLDRYVSQIMASGENTVDRLVAVQRYLNLIGRREEAVHLYFLLSARLIYASISERLAELAGPVARDRVFSRVHVPPVGAPPDEFPSATRQLMDSLAEELTPEVYRRVLAGNHHRVPAEAFARHREWLAEAGSIDGFLKRAHDEAVAEITRHMEEG
jgi:hypothetical protein